MARKIRKSRSENIRWNQMIEALRLMNFGLNNIRLYPPGHSEVVGTVKRLVETLGPILEEQEDVGFGFMEELLYIEGSVSIEETVSNQMLVDRFARCRVKYLTFMKGIGVEDLSILLQILNAEAIKPSAVMPAEQLHLKGVKTIHIVEAEVDDIASKSKAGKRKTLYDWYVRGIDALRAAQDGLKAGPDADLKPLYRFVDDMTATMRNKGYEPYLLLPHLGRGLDPHLAHSVNVAVLASALGDLIRLNSGQMTTMVMAAMLHDMGRVTIPLEWTQDHTQLSPAERLTARQHTDWGFLLLTRHEDVAPQTSLIAAHHHGIPPRRVANAEATLPPSYAADIYHRLIDIADVYDLGMISDRYYWKKQRPERILSAVMQRRGARFDPAMVKLLVTCVGFYPVGTLVQLDDGRRGIVVRPNLANPSRPKVYMFEEPETVPTPPPGAPPPAPGTPAEPQEPEPVILDTSELEQSGLRFKASVVRSLQPLPGLDIPGLLEKKKDYLLSYTI
ncbi:MAG: HD domain-containing protein [Elusimicrobia bacterium]|nr:HD domain-containing protein [Elusimicrobiota bacterium]